MSPANLPALLQRFFTDRLRAQLGASPHTVASYRGTFRLLLLFASKRLAREPSHLRVEDLGVALLGDFLDHLEHARASTAKTRNTRLAAVRAFFRFVAYTEPACSLQSQQVLAIPNKRHERRQVRIPYRRGDHRPRRRPGPGHVDRASRPHLAACGSTDRPAQCGTPLPPTRRRGSRCWRTRSVLRKGAQDTLHSPAA